MSKPGKVFFAAFFFLFLAITSVSVFVYQGFVKNPASSEEKVVIYEVTPGRSFVDIASDLQSHGVIRNSKFFNIFARITGGRSKIKAGEYEFKTTMLPATVLSVLTSGKSVFRKFTVAEGLSIFEIAELYEKQGFGTASSFLQTVSDPKLIQDLLKSPAGSGVIDEPIETLEGYLFPETYQITKYTSTKELVTNMVQTFLKQYEELNKLAGQLGWSRHKVVTFASLIEKETGASFERSKISAVFHNRLKKGMRLQTDPTIIYGKAKETGKIEINITRDDLTRPTPYNTYTIFGMPPGPIANPGTESLKAVFAPEKSNVLYFVSRNDGTQVFSETLEAHSNAVKKFQLDAKARANKSWRDLKRGEAGLRGPTH